MKRVWSKVKAILAAWLFMPKPTQTYKGCCDRAKDEEQEPEQKPGGFIY